MSITTQNPDIEGHLSADVIGDTNRLYLTLTAEDNAKPFRLTISGKDAKRLFAWLTGETT